MICADRIILRGVQIIADKKGNDNGHVHGMDILKVEHS